MSTASTLTRRAPLAALWRRIKLERAWYAMMALPVVYLVIFHYVPMAGIVLAFQDYKMGRGVFGSDWVGFKWFIQFFESFYFWRLMRNTLLLSFYSIVFGFPVPIIFALMLNEMKVLPLKRVVQTVSYLPHFISLVIIVGMLVTFLSPNNGIINIVIKSLGGEPINFLGLQSWFRPLYIGSGIWQHFGFSSIIYLAAIAGISQELYDAAEVDGASRIQRIRFVTIPGMAPTIIILLILNLGRALAVDWEKVLLMYTPATYEVADVIATYVYRRGIIDSKYGFGSAVGLFANVINLIFLVVFNRLARRFTDTSLW
ncbi:MAG: ABC transporter permease subunit [Spirochaetaceae bacterium]|nr:ABC transporter permease subunit [Spirochaetaceae bacterium]